MPAARATTRSPKRQRAARPDARVLRAIASDKRLRILSWLKDPRRHFRPQVYGDLVADGVCGNFIAEKLGVRQPTASAHLRLLLDAGLLRARRVQRFTFYRRDEARIRALRDELAGI